MFCLINRRGEERKRHTFWKRKDYDGKDSLDTKILIYFDYPEKIKGTSFLTWSYMDTERDDDQWLYLPALRKIRRISGDNKEDSFLGTDFTFDDMGDRQVWEDMYKLLRTEEYAGKECYVVEAIPKEILKKKNYIYSKKIFWIWKGEWVILKGEYYDWKERHFKSLKMDWHKVDNIWTPRKFQMKNLHTGHKTIIDISNAVYNTGLSEDIFSKRSLERSK